MLSHIKLFGKVIITAQQQQQPPRLSSARGSADLLEEAARRARAEARLPCPRCRSRDTKFCYFNNYNVNQPRHFCRACHRYWTAGGAIRNVPVGSGRRSRNRAMMLQSSPHADTRDDRPSSAAGDGSPPVFFGTLGAGFFPPYYHDSSSHVTAPPAYNAGGLPDTTDQWWWHATTTAEPSVASNSAF